MDQLGGSIKGKRIVGEKLGEKYRGTLGRESVRELGRESWRKDRRESGREFGRDSQTKPLPIS
jgi:hypothetical protein